MGLDMYLYKKIYVKNWSHQRPEEKDVISIIRGNTPRPDIKPERISYIVEEVGYWRKFNALHQWFVDNCGDGEDNCQEMYVDDSKIEEILGILKEVKGAIDSNDLEKVQELLPPSEGFFFGSTEIDEWYKQDVENSIILFEDLLKEVKENGNFRGDFYYVASW